MRTQKAIVLLLMLAPCLIYAQNSGKITGKLTGADTKQKLEGGTVSVLNATTGIFIRHGLSNKKGEFTISGLPLQTDLSVIVSFTGYGDSSSIITISKLKPTTNTGEWKLKPAGEELEQVTVTARKAPFIVKKDTIEFNADAFKSLPADMVQDLLRKLPGIVMDQEGNITVNGQKVNKIKVDGRDFFGGNLKIAVENLPGAVIDKVQVYETREKGDEYKSVVRPPSSDLLPPQVFLIDG